MTPNCKGLFKPEFLSCLCYCFLHFLTFYTSKLDNEGNDFLLFLVAL